ncbi:MAG: CBS domain-containing protein [Planctomycetota bacterium]|jgi:CBS domain-containing protein
MLQVKEIMIKNVVSVKKDAPIYEAIELLRRNHISSMPVVEDDLTLIGVLSERDVISLLLLILWHSLRFTLMKMKVC